MKNNVTSLRTRFLTWLLLAASCVLLRADIIGDWNNQALTAIRTETLISPQASRDLAMLHTAIYNAVEGIAGDYYLFTSGSYSGPSGTAPGGASMEAAAAAAAHTILQSLYTAPALSAAFSSLYSTQISALPDDQARLDGINFGTLVANDILNWRSADGAADAGDPGLYTPVGTVGHWAPTPASYSAAALPGWGDVTTFGITGTAGFTGSLGMANADYVQTAQYATDYNTVKDLGSSTSGTRTADELNAAYFWAAVPGTISTAGMWNEIAEIAASSALLTLQEKARLFAALNVAMADTAIVTWETKFEVDFWSPITAIVNGSADGNAATIEDAAWEPLLDSPGYPAYFSDHAALAAAAAQVLGTALGDSFVFSLGSDIDGNGSDDQTRNFTGFLQAATENANAQIWAGVSYGTSNMDSMTAGSNVADDVLNNHFAPVPEPAGALLVVLGAGLLGLRRRRA